MRRIKLFSIFVFMFLLVMLFSFAACQKEYEREITEKEVPQAILRAFTTSYPDATIREYSEEVAEGKTYYEISFEFQGTEIDILYNIEGEVIELEETIDAEEMPDQIREAIAREIPQFSLIRIERVKEEEKVFYEAKVLNKEDNKNYELFFSESGELLEKELMGEEEEY